MINASASLLQIGSALSVSGVKVLIQPWVRQGLHRVTAQTE
ncbi:hypothetical protein [Paenibacillus sp. TSA_86.1]